MNLYKNNLERIGNQTFLEPAEIEPVLRAIDFANRQITAGYDAETTIIAQNTAGELRNLLHALGADFTYIDRAVENLPPVEETR